MREGTLAGFFAREGAVILGDHTERPPVREKLISDCRWVFCVEWNIVKVIPTTLSLKFELI